VNSAPPHVSPGGETAHLPRSAPCFDHAFDDALVCRCGMNWWTHQRLPEKCPLNARGCNRGEGAVQPRTRHRHA
jgi:hypothetical protein